MVNKFLLSLNLGKYCSFRGKCSREKEPKGKMSQEQKSQKGKMSKRKKAHWQNVQEKKDPLAKCPLEKRPTSKMSTGKMSTSRWKRANKKGQNSYNHFIPLSERSELRGGISLPIWSMGEKMSSVCLSCIF